MIKEGNKMRYTVDIEASVDALVHCLRIVNQIHDIDEWRVSVNAGGIDYGIYFNFDIEEKELEICNQPARGYDDSLYLEDIIELINREEDEDE